MDYLKAQIYEPDLKLNGTLPELIDQANRYPSDYSDEALERISELAKDYGMDEQYVQIPLLIKAERKRTGVPYERMKIDWYLSNQISYSESNFEGNEGVELEIRNEDDRVLISLTGIDDDGEWNAAGFYCIDEFMSGEDNWLDAAIGNILYYSKMYEEE